MKFSFDECEIINNFLEQEEQTPSQEEFIKNMNNVKVNTEDTELKEICSSILSKIKYIDENKYKNIVSNLPVENLTNY